MIRQFSKAIMHNTYIIAHYYHVVQWHRRVFLIQWPSSILHFILYIYIYTHTHTYMFVCVCVCMCICVCIYIYIYSHNSRQKHISKTALPFCSMNSNNNSSKEFIHQLVTQLIPLTHNYCTTVYYVLSQLKLIKQVTKIITWKECQ